MSTSFLSELKFSDYDGAVVTPHGIYPYLVYNAFILHGSAVTLGDQQHEDNNGVNYVSCTVKHVRVRGVVEVYDDIHELNRPDGELTVVLYKCPVKYIGGMVYPVVNYNDFVQMKDFFLYSSPNYVLSWKKYQIQATTEQFRVSDTDVELTCSKRFVIGPTDVLCMACLLVSRELYAYMLPHFSSKVVYDFN